MDDFQADLRVYHGLRVFAQAYRSFVEDRMLTTFGPRWVEKASLASGSDPQKPLDSYALLKTTLDRWNEVFRAVLTPGVRNRVGLVFEARNRIAHEDPIANDEAISFLSAMRLVIESVGKKDTVSALKALVDQQIRATKPEPGPQPDPVEPGGGTLPIQLEPADIQEFKNRLLICHKARIIVEYADGRLREIQWIADRIRADSNIISNLRSRPEFRRGEWQKRGIARVRVVIDDKAPSIGG
jgi:hypothetical protein